VGPLCKLRKAWKSITYLVDPKMSSDLSFGYRKLYKVDLVLTLLSVPSIRVVLMDWRFASTQYRRSLLGSRARPLGQPMSVSTSTRGSEPSIPEVAIRGVWPQSDQNIILHRKENITISLPRFL